MKGVDIFCASPASTAICSSMEHRSMVRHGTRPINNPHLQDHRKSRSLPAPCSSQLPVNPIPNYLRQKNRKSSAKESDISTRKSCADRLINTSPPGSSRYLLSDTPFFDFLSEDSDQISTSPIDHSPSLKKYSSSLRARQLSSNDYPLLKSSSSRAQQQSSNDSPLSLKARQLVRSNDSPLLKSSSSRARQLVSSNESPLSLKARQLVSTNDSPLFKSSSPRARQLVSSNESPLFKSSSLKARQLGSNDSLLLKSSSSRARQLSSINDSPSSVLKYSSSSTQSRDRQVVVLRVSLHCKGCEGKVRKHISRMEGVTSFSIDLATKKVTIIGDITPSSVLESVSRVKNAQFWQSPTSSSSSSPSSMVNMSY